MSVESVATALRDHGSREQRSADGLRFSCPLHEDRRPSLTVKEGSSDGVVVKCFPCEARYDNNRDYVAALIIELGLSWADFQPPRVDPRLVEEYQYERADGRYLFSVLRYDPKEFKQKVVVSRSPWIVEPGGLGGIKPVPFRLPELKAALAAGTDVYICEGEADVLALVKQGLVATSNPGGAGKWLPEFAEHFEGSSSCVFVVPDWDSPDKGAKGQQHALSVAENLTGAGVAVEFRRAASGKDVRDHLSAGHPVDGLQVVTAAGLAECVDAAQQSATAAEIAEQVQARLRSLRADKQARQKLAEEEASGLFPGFTALSLKEMLAEDRPEARWLIEGLLREGHKAVLTAAFKVGKTTLLANLVQALADGVPLFGRFAVGEVTGTVVVFDYELTRDDAADLYERLDIANPDRVVVETLRGTGFSLANTVHAERTVELLREQECAVWVIDPYGRAMRGFGSENSNDDVGNFLATVDRIATEAGVQGVVISAHTGRGEQAVGEEHARGATKIDDDPDARWIYTRDESGNRFFRAEGRNKISAPELTLSFDPKTERLSASDLTRRDARLAPKARQVCRIVQQEPGIAATALQDRLPGKDPKSKRPFINYALSRGWITETPGPKNSKLYDVGPEAPPLKFDLGDS